LPVNDHHLVPIALAVLFLVSVLGVPAFVTPWVAFALILFGVWTNPLLLFNLPLRARDKSVLANPALFTLAGYFLAEGGAPKRLVRVFYALFGQFRGGPAIVYWFWSAHSSPHLRELQA